jgi:general secretion pathway protein L
MISGSAIERLSASGAEFAAKAGKLQAPVWNALTFPLMEGMIVPKKAVSASIEKGALWVVYGSRFLSKIMVKDFRRYAFEEGKYPGPDGLASTVSIALRELKAEGTGIILCIPGDWVIMRTAQLPSTVKENIADVISYELDRLTPFSSENAYYDFRVMGESSGMLSVVIAAARADLVNQYLDALREKSIEVEKITINLSNTGTLCSYVSQEKNPVFLNAGPLEYEGGVLRDNVLLSSFGDSLHGKDGRSKIEAMAAVLEPVVAAAAEQNGSPPAIVCLGDGNCGELGDQLNAPVKVLSDNDIKQKLLADKEGISSAAAGGALESLWSGARGFNLLVKGAYDRARPSMAVTLVLIILLLVALIPYVLLPLQKEERRLAEIDRQISLRKEEVMKVEGLRKEADVLMNEMAAIRAFKETRPMALVILRELTGILPKTAWLTRIKMTETTVDIEGYAASASEILPKLEQSQYFKKVEFSSPTVRDTRLNADRFVMKMEIEGSVKKGEEKEKDGAKK